MFCSRHAARCRTRQVGTAGCAHYCTLLSLMDGNKYIYIGCLPAAHQSNNVIHLYLYGVGQQRCFVQHSSYIYIAMTRFTYMCRNLGVLS